jgi:hypothetical protein
MVNADVLLPEGTQMSENALVPYRDILEMAQAVVKGRLFPDVDTPEKALTLMLLCQSEGLHPMQALTRYHIIKGRPALKADAMLAAFMERGGTVKWKEWTNEACEAVFTSGGCPDGVVVRWTMADAQRAGVTGNPTWTRYPRQMLKARVASDGVRMADPAVNQGRYTPEEVQDFEDPKGTRVPIDAEIVAPTAPQTPPERLSARGQTTEEHLDAAAVNRNSSVAQYTHCSDCGAEIKQFPSESKDFPGRLYWQCEGARFEYLDAVKNGVPVAKAKAQIKAHFGGGSRLWAETWPTKQQVALMDEGVKQATTGQILSHVHTAPKKPIKEQLEDIEKDTAARLKAERVAELSQGFNEATR